MSDRKRIVITFCLNNFIIVVEVIVGFLSGSLALLSDASHNFIDSVIMLSIILGLTQARKSATTRHSYGYGRTPVLITIFSSLLTIILALFIFIEAYKRLFASPTSMPNGLPILITSTVAFVLKATIAYISSKGKDISTRVVFFPTLADTFSALFVMIGSVILIFNKTFVFIDPLLSVGIGVFLVVSIVKVLKEAIDIIMEAAPKDLKMDEVVAAIKTNKMVVDVHDIHAWSISSGVHALSGHITINNCTLEESNKVANQTKKLLKDKFSIEHVTLEVECEHYEEFNK